MTTIVFPTERLLKGSTQSGNVGAAGAELHSEEQIPAKVFILLQGQINVSISARNGRRLMFDPSCRHAWRGSRVILRILRNSICTGICAAARDKHGTQRSGKTRPAPFGVHCQRPANRIRYSHTRLTHRWRNWRVRWHLPRIRHSYSRRHAAQPNCQPARFKPDGHESSCIGSLRRSSKCPVRGWRIKLPHGSVS